MNNRKLKLQHVFKHRKECMVRKQGFQSTHPKMTTSAKVVSLNDITSHASLGFGLYMSLACRPVVVVEYGTEPSRNCVVIDHQYFNSPARRPRAALGKKIATLLSLS